MSYENVSINERPNHFMILDAIAKGMANINKITKVTKLNEVKIELIINDFNQRLVIKLEIKGFLGRRKKTEIRITEPGLRLLNTKKQELEQKSEQIQRWYNSVDRSRLESFMDSNRTWIPMMLLSGIMNTMFFMSMMYLI